MYDRSVRIGGLACALLVACRYTAPDGGDLTPDGFDLPTPDGVNTTPDGNPEPDTLVPPPDAPTTALCAGYVSLSGGFPAGATYRGVNTKVGWSTARQTCLDDGADLVVIDNAAEAAATTTLVEDPNNSLFHWVGLRDDPTTGTDNDFVSVRGGAPTYAPWGDDQPTGGSQDCVLIGDFGAPHELFDFSCTAIQVFVCECLP